jgi:CheY-like chemotaxis protein
LNVLTIQGVYGVMTLSLLIGLVPIIRPKHSILTILAALVYTLVLMYVTRGIVDEEGLSSWDHFAQTDMRANLIIMIGLSAFVSTIIYNLYVKNFLKSVELEAANDHLEEQVRERTKELEEQTAAAQAASKVKGRFLSGMNHELRTPLNAIVGMANIARNTQDKAKSDEAAAEIEQQSARIIAILNDMSEIMADEKSLIPEESSGVPELVGKHILVVDDVEINRTVFAGLIECTEAAVDDAKDGHEAVELFGKSPEGYYDLILMDIMMPRMDGNEATRRIRAMDRADAKTTPIVAISANALTSDVEGALNAGMNRHIAKPVDFDVIMRTLREFIG